MRRQLDPRIWRVALLGNPPKLSLACEPRTRGFYHQYHLASPHFQAS